jgi:hypothetical protein
MSRIVVRAMVAGRAGRLAPLSVPICLALAACTAGPEPSGGTSSRADAATQAACRQRAEQIYEQQHRGEIYSPQSGINTPFSANYAPGATDRGLSDQFARDRMIRDCVRNTGTGAERTETPPSPPPTAPDRR